MEAIQFLCILEIFQIDSFIIYKLSLSQTTTQRRLKALKETLIEGFVKHSSTLYNPTIDATPVFVVDKVSL